MEDTTFEINGTTYELIYALKRVEMAENAIKKSVISVFNEQPTIAEARTLAAMGLRQQGSAAWINPAQAIPIVTDYIEQNGYLSLIEKVVNALMRDCGFLFRES